MKSSASPIQRPRRHGGFVLLEIMLGVAIFAIGVLAMGRAVNNCLAVESARQDVDRARLALENGMAQVEAGAIPTDKASSTKLTGAFDGMTLKLARHPVPAKNEQGVKLTGLYQVDLEVDWTEENEPQSKQISFYVLRH